MRLKKKFLSEEKEAQEKKIHQLRWSRKREPLVKTNFRKRSFHLRIRIKKQNMEFRPKTGSPTWVKAKVEASTVINELEKKINQLAKILRERNMRWKM